MDYCTYNSVKIIWVARVKAYETNIDFVTDFGV